MGNLQAELGRVSIRSLSEDIYSGPGVLAFDPTSMELLHARQLASYATYRLIL